MKQTKSFAQVVQRMSLMAVFLLLTLICYAQSIIVKGSIKDQAGDPIAGATVKILGTTTGGVSDADGHYSISCSAQSTLEFSYIGFSTRAIDVKGRKNIDVTLDEGSQNIDEVVVTALGIKKDAKKLGYAVSSIGSADLSRTGSPSIASGLYGKATGVRIQSAPGGNSAISVSVRGLSTITGNTQPLLVLDGVPIHNGNANNNDYWSNQRIAANGLVDINPEDIENISILKGAAASALYGSEAANGVLMITTKSATRGTGTHVDFNASIGFDKVAYMPEIQKKFGPGYDNWALGDGDEAVTGLRSIYKDRAGNTITTPRPTIYSYGPAYDGNRKVTYFDGTQRAYEPIEHNQWADIFRTGVNQNYNVAITNGSEHNNVRFSYTYNQTRAMQYNSENSRHNFNLAGAFDVTPTLKLNYSASYQPQRIKNRPYRITRLTNNYSGMFGGFTDLAYIREHTVTSLGYMNGVAQINGGSPNTMTPDETFLYSPMGSTSLISEYFWNVFSKNEYINHERFMGAVNPTWRIMDGLTLSGRIATDMTTDKIENKNNTENAHSFSTNGQYSDLYALSNSRYRIYYGDVMLTFDKTFNKLHNLTASAGWTGRREDYYFSSVSTNQGLTQENWFHLNASVGTKIADMDKQDQLRTGLFLTASYGYDSWLYLEGTLRQEKTSTLKKDNNTFYYPSMSGSVIYTELLKGKRPAWWDYGKLRLSYGVVGNSPTIYLANMAYSQGTITRSSTYTYNFVPTNIGNESIKPERKYEYEVGLENKWLNNRLGMELSYYYNDIKDQILTTTSAASMGAHSMLMNVGELTNSGIELSLYGTPLLNKDWRVDLNVNMAFNKNKVKKLADGLDVLSHMTADNGAASLESHVGEPMGDWYAYTYKTDANGNRIVGTNGLYITDTSVRHKVGNAMPKATGGFGGTISYKNLALTFNFDFRIGGDVLNLPWQYMMDAGNIKDAVGVRDAATGGIYYYSDTDKAEDKPSIHIVNPADVPNYQRGVTKINGHYVWDNGLIQPGVKEDGTPNDIVVTQFEANDSQYGWGTGATQSYAGAIQKNSYVKCREITLAYTLPKTLTRKFHCNNLTVAAYLRNPFYIYRTLKLFDAESTDGTSWIYQAQIGGTTATARSFGLTLRANF
jgi:tonB-linked outer membrane protein, susC/ragA family